MQNIKEKLAILQYCGIFYGEQRTRKDNMGQLTKGMYGTQFSRTGNTLFGLASGQMRASGKLAHNGGWYNLSGEKLGFGDLALGDMRRIAGEIEENEAFIVLSEGDSSWNHPQGVSEDAPGKRYVLDHAMYFIKKDSIYYIRSDFDPRRENVVDKDGIEELHRANILIIAMGMLLARRVARLRSNQEQ